MRYHTKQLFMLTVVTAVALWLAIVGARERALRSEVASLRGELDQLAKSVDAVRAYVLKGPPELRLTSGRRAAEYDRDGWPVRSSELHAENFGPSWPFRARIVRVSGSLIGVCYFTVDDVSYALNDLAKSAGYAAPNAAVLRNGPGPPAGDLADVAPVLDVAYRLCDRVRFEHVEKPYALPSR